MCPLAKAEKRLKDCLDRWKQAEASYQEPDAFVRHTQAVIVGLRSVTFLLQAAKRQISGFEPWYAGWQEKMRQDRVLRWLVETRNKIEKVGDIEPASTLRMTFSSSWLDDDEDVLDVPASYTAIKAADLFAKLIGPRSQDEEALIRFQREWCHPDLPGTELLEALVYCYGFLQQLLLDGHRCLEGSAIKECPFHTTIQHSSSRLPMEMQGGHSGRSAWYRLIDRTTSAYAFISLPLIWLLAQSPNFSSKRRNAISIDSKWRWLISPAAVGVQTPGVLRRSAGSTVPRS